MEQIFNLFIYSQNGLITEVGAIEHKHGGSDQEKLNFLKANVETDSILAQRFPLPPNFLIKSEGNIHRGIDYETYRDLCNQGHALLIFQGIFEHYNAPQNLLSVTTPIRDGYVYIEGEEMLKAPASEAPPFVHVNKQDPWHKDYIDEKGFYFDRLINDDFFEAIRVLYNSRHYVSAMKLLMICLDTMAYLEYGDVPRNFQQWVSVYADLATLEITPEELWEFRNSILHMTNLDSRKVKSGQVKRLLFYVAHEQTSYAKDTDEGKYFKFKDLITSVANGIANWAHTYNTERDKIEIFIERYNRIISDKRITLLRFKETESQHREL